MDRLEAMSILVIAAEAGSLSAASRRLGTPLATVSRKIAQLETHLGTRLLNRSSRRLTLTDAGKSYVAACKRIIEEVGEAERTAAGEYRAPRGDLVITAPIVFGRVHVLPVVADFLATYPEIDVQLTLSDRIVNLHEEHIDVAVRIGELPDSNLVATRLGVIHRVVCASPAYFSRRGMPSIPAELEMHDCVTFESLMSPTYWSFFSGRNEVSIPIHSRLSVNTAEAAIDAAIAGIGITRVLSYQIADSVRNGMLDVALRNFEPPASPVNFVYTDRRLLPIKLRAFLDFAAPRLRERLSPSLAQA